MNDYTDFKEGISQKLEDKIADRSSLEEELDALQREIEGLEFMALGADIYNGHSPICSESQGLTDAIREVLEGKADPMRPAEIRDALRESGFNIDAYKQPMAVLHTTLRRLKEQQEIELVKESGKICYQMAEEDTVPF